MILAEALRQLSNQLHVAGISPKKLQLSQGGPYFHASAFDMAPDAIITEQATCGFSTERDLAVMKALVEWTERRVAREGAKDGLEVCQTERSDGIGAFPVSDPAHVEKARSNALYEANERYVWATWWDDESIGFTNTLLKDMARTSAQAANILQICNGLHCSEIKLIRPLHNSSKADVLILIAFTSDGGVFSGGACGPKENEAEVLERAFAELYRHLLAFEKYKKNPKEVSSFYEKRLLYFASGEGRAKVLRRLSMSGVEVIQLPALKYDEEIPSRFREFIYVHRCLFENQPPFVDGAVERLCL